MVAPGLAGLDTTLVLHDASRIGSPAATFGILEGNPVHDDIRAVAAGCAERGVGVDFACDVVLNRKQEIVAAFAGELFAMHAAATRRARTVAMRPVDRLYDVVVTTNAGYPLDQNLYQTVKGMSAAAKIVRPGGLILVAAECRDGFPDHGGYRRELGLAATPQALLSAIKARHETRPDQWQVQVQARIQVMARVGVYTSGLNEEELSEAHLQAVPDISEAIRAELRQSSGGACALLPEGPLTVPYQVGAANGTTVN